MVLLLICAVMWGQHGDLLGGFPNELHKEKELTIILLNRIHLSFLYPQAVCRHVECGHSWASWRCELSASAQLPEKTRPLCDRVSFDILRSADPHKVNNYSYLTSEVCGLNVLMSVMLLLFSLQEVKAAPLKFVTDLAFEDSWSQLLMSTLAPLGYIKVILSASY